MVVQKGLGKGLGSLIPNRRNLGKPSQAAVTSFGLPMSSHKEQSNLSTTTPSGGNGNGSLLVPISKILANPYQPREQFDHQHLEELLDSVKRHGILQPLVVTRKANGAYALIAGERRLRAAEMAGLTEVPVVLRENVDNSALLELAVIENVQRADLNPIEEAHAYQRLSDGFGLTQEEVAQRVGKSRAKVANIVRLLTLPKEIQDGLKAGKITEGHGKVLAGLSSEADQLRVYGQIAMHSLTVSETVQHTTRRAPSLGGGKRSHDVSPELRSDVKTLESTLGTKVTFHDIGGKGKMVVEYYSEEERKAILEKIIHARNEVAA